MMNKKKVAKLLALTKFGDAHDLVWWLDQDRFQKDEELVNGLLEMFERPHRVMLRKDTKTHGWDIQP